MKFSKETMIGLVCHDHNEAFEIVEETMIDQRRWNTVYSIVFKYDNKYYISYYEQGSTEMQDTRPYEYEGDEIDCAEVVPVEKTTIVYEELT